MQFLLWSPHLGIRFVIGISVVLAKREIFAVFCDADDCDGIVAYESDRVPNCAVVAEKELGHILVEDGDSHGIWLIRRLELTTLNDRNNHCLKIIGADVVGVCLYMNCLRGVIDTRVSAVSQMSI